MRELNNILQKTKKISSKVNGWVVMWGVSWAAYFSWFWHKALFYDPEGNLVAGHVNIWGDWAAHLTMTTAMAVRGLILSSSPFIIDQPFRYPFFINLISALLIKISVPLLPAMILPSLVASTLIPLVLYWWYRPILGSTKKALLASWLFMANGGLGFLVLLKEMQNSSQPLSLLINPDHEYTRLDDYFIKYINVIDSMIIPQRAFTFGFPIALIISGWVYRQVFINKKHSSLQFVLAGVLLGSLVIIHTHSLLAMSLVLSWWVGSYFLTEISVSKKKFSKALQLAKPWFFLGISSLAVFLFLITAFGWLRLSSQNFQSWFPGWYAKEFNVPWLTFWLWNWGITPLLAIWGLIVLLRNSQKRWLAIRVFSPFFIWFILGNLFLFQPFIWDNTKVFTWVQLGFAALAVLAVSSWWNLKKYQILGRATAVAAVVVMSASGTLDIYRIARHDLHSYTLYSAEELSLANWVVTNTPSSSRWLTETHHNHWLFNLTGRQALLTYPGWLWTHGYDYQTIDQEGAQMRLHPVQSLELFEKYQIDYIVWERPAPVTHWVTVHQSDRYVIQQPPSATD
jgi:hypothetical protein